MTATTEKTQFSPSEALLLQDMDNATSDTLGRSKSEMNLKEFVYSQLSAQLESSCSVASSERRLSGVTNSSTRSSLSRRSSALLHNITANSQSNSPVSTSSYHQNTHTWNFDITKTLTSLSPDVDMVYILERQAETAGILKEKNADLTEVLDASQEQYRVLCQRLMLRINLIDTVRQELHAVFRQIRRIKQKLSQDTRKS